MVNSLPELTCLREIWGVYVFLCGEENGFRYGTTWLNWKTPTFLIFQEAHIISLKQTSKKTKFEAKEQGVKDQKWKNKTDNFQIQKTVWEKFHKNSCSHNLHKPEMPENLQVWEFSF